MKLTPDPLGLPEGSVRATLSILSVGTLCALALLQKPIPPELVGIAGAAVGAYFQNRGPKDERPAG